MFNNCDLHNLTFPPLTGCDTNLYSMRLFIKTTEASLIVDSFNLIFEGEIHMIRARS